MDVEFGMTVADEFQLKITSLEAPKPSSTCLRCNKREITLNMGRTTNKKSSKPKPAKSEKQLKVQSTEFQLDLGALDGYDLPNIDENEDLHEEPKSKKLKQSKPQVLGIDYREREEKRLEELLFGELFKKLEQEPQSKIDTGKSSASKKKLRKQTNKASSEAKDSLPEDVYGKNLGLSSTAGRQAVWVDEDDEDLK